jgi:hypothetical protein
MTFECRQTCLLQAHRVAFAATGRLDNARCDAGVNNSGLRGAVRSTLSVALKASPTLRVISSSNEPSSRLMKGRIDATPLSPRRTWEFYRNARTCTGALRAFFGIAATFLNVLSHEVSKARPRYGA